MTTIVARTFSTAGSAQAAVDELQRQGFSSEAVRTSTGDGGIIVSVRAEFGEGQKATRILESHGPVGMSLGHAQAQRWRADDRATNVFTTDVHDQEAAPLSTALGLPLIFPNPAPFSSMLGLSLLSASQTPSVKLLSENPAPLSSSLGLPLLMTSDRKPVKLPSNNPAPLSSALGLPLLTSSVEKPANLPSNNAAPFSALLRLPVLTRDAKAPLPQSASTTDTLHTH